MFAHFIFGGERPEKVVATGHLDNNGELPWQTVEQRS